MVLVLLKSACTVSRPFLLLTLPNEWLGCKWARSWEATQLGQVTPTNQRSMSYYMILCSEVKSGEGKRSVGMFGVIVSAFQGSCYVWWSLSFLGMAEHLSARWKVVHEFLPLFCLSRQLLLYLLNWFCLYPWVFLHLPFWFSTPSCSVCVNKWVAVWCLAASQG